MNEARTATSGDTADAPRKSYWTPSEIDFDIFQLSPEGLPPEQQQRAMTQLKRYTETYQKSFMGYQATQTMEFCELAKYLNVSINNIGDSFSNPNWDGDAPPDGFFRVNCKWMERAVLDYYAQLWGAKTPRLVKEDDVGREEWLETYWGYVVSMGSTEGNLLAIRSARDYLNGTRLQFDKADLITNAVPAYVASLDSTLAGSRNGFSAILMWDYLSKRSYRQQMEEARNALDVAEYAHNQLRCLYKGLCKDSYDEKMVTRAPESLGIVFPRPSRDLVKQYALASVGKSSHILIMRHVTKCMVDTLFKDLKKDLEKHGGLVAHVPSESERVQEALQQGW